MLYSLRAQDWVRLRVVKSHCVNFHSSYLPRRFYQLQKMADAANKYPENVEGKFYVDDQCIDCDLCRETAPANFRRNDDGGHSYVYKQPESPEEEALCKEAMEGCPVEAIGSDGA
jgi:ferredoxin